MQRIVVEHSRYHDWRDGTPKEVAAAQTAFEAGEQTWEPKQAVNSDKLLVRHTVDEANHTTVGIPDEQIERHRAYQKKKYDRDLTEVEAAGEFLEWFVMPQHTTRADWTGIEHDGSLDLIDHLRARLPKPDSRPSSRKGKIDRPPALWVPTGKRVQSLWHTHVDRGPGIDPLDGDWRHNLTTDTASGYTNRRDWESKALGGDPVGSGTGVGTGTSTGVGTTSLTNSGAAFPTAGQGLAGHIVVTGARWAVIVSNTATVLTIDRWYDPGTLGTGSNPATGVYVILPGNAPAWYNALTGDSGAPAASDTFLQNEITTGGLARAIGAYSHTAAATTYSLVTVSNATSTFTVNKEAQFSAAFKTANTNDGGAMPFESLEPNPPTVVSGDQLTQTAAITVG